MKDPNVSNNEGSRREDNFPTYRDIDRIEIQLQQIRDLINQISTKVSARDEVDLTPTLSAIGKLDQKTDVITQKLPPLPALYAAGVIILGAVGLSYNDLRSLDKPIEQAATSVDKTTKDLSTTVNSIKTDFIKLDELTTKLTPLMEKVNTLDVSFARLLVDVQQIHALTPPVNLPPSSKPGQNDDMLDKLDGSKNLALRRSF